MPTPSQSVWLCCRSLRLAGVVMAGADFEVGEGDFTSTSVAISGLDIQVMNTGCEVNVIGIATELRNSMLNAGRVHSRL